MYPASASDISCIMHVPNSYIRVHLRFFKGGCH
jgi:hypothetical protein